MFKKLDFSGFNGHFDVNKVNFKGLYRYLEPTCGIFHGLCHGNCVLRHVLEILQLKKLCFRGLKGQFDVKKGHF